MDEKTKKFIEFINSLSDEKIAALSNKLDELYDDKSSAEYQECMNAIELLKVKRVCLELNEDNE